MGIRFGTYKVQHLNQTLVPQKDFHKHALYE